MFKIISCIDNQFGIGNKNELLYRIKDDLKQFKQYTTNNVVIMGFNTFKSLGYKSLPNRINIVLSNRHHDNYSDVIFVNSINEVIDVCEKNYIDKEWFVIGGSSIYKQFLELGIVDEMVLTCVDYTKNADAYFPSINDLEWKVINLSEVKSFQENDVTINFTFKKFIKIKNQN